MSRNYSFILLAVLFLGFGCASSQLFLKEEQETPETSSISEDEQLQITQFLEEMNEEFDQSLAQQVFDHELIKWIIIYKDLDFLQPDFSQATKELSTISDKVKYAGIAIDLKFKFKVLASDIPADYYEAIFKVGNIEISLQSTPTKEYTLRVDSCHIFVTDDDFVLQDDMESEMNRYLTSYLVGENSENKRHLGEASPDRSVKKEELQAKRKEMEANRENRIAPEESIAINEFYTLLEQVYLDKMALGDTSKVTEDDPDIFEVYEELKARAIRDASHIEMQEETPMQESSTSEDSSNSLEQGSVKTPEEWSEETKSNYHNFLQKVVKKMVKWEHVSAKRLKSIGKKYTMMGKVKEGIINVEHDIEGMAKSSVEDFKKLVGGH